MILKTNKSPEVKHPYRSPKTKAVYMKTQGIICGSKIIPEANTTEMEEGDDNW